MQIENAVSQNWRTNCCCSHKCFTSICFCQKFPRLCLSRRRATVESSSLKNLKTKVPRFSRWWCQRKRGCRRFSAVQSAVLCLTRGHAFVTHGAGPVVRLAFFPPKKMTILVFKDQSYVCMWMGVQYLSSALEGSPSEWLGRRQRAAGRNLVAATRGFLWILSRDTIVVQSVGCTDSEARGSFFYLGVEGSMQLRVVCLRERE